MSSLMVKRKSRMEIRVADGAGGMMKVEDRRFEKGKWPISFEVPVANEQADRWSRYLTEIDRWNAHRHAARR
jgi:hypothetical protein